MSLFIKIWGVLKKIVFALLIIFALLIVLSMLNIPGGIKLLIVQSGSMEPNIKLGSVVVIKSQDEYLVNDVVTIKDTTDNTVTFTHRIIEEFKTDNVVTFKTKGDANESADPGLKLPQNIIGKVIFTVPYVGYPVNFAKTREGLLILVIIPATIIIYSEILNIKKEIQKNILSKKKTQNEKSIS